MKQPVKKSTNESFASFSGATSDNGSIIGDIKIHGGVIASIVKEALREIPGVSRLSGSSMMDNLAEIIGSRQFLNRAITVKFNENFVDVELSVNIYYGTSLPLVAAEIQEKVGAMIHSITGLNVGQVNVTIRGIDDPVAAENNENDAKEN